MIYPSVQLRSVAYSTRFRNVIESWRRGAITTWRFINYRLSHLSLSACAAWRWTPSPRNGKENRRGEKNSGRRREVGSGSKETRRMEGKKSFLVSSRFNYFAGLLIHGCDIQRVYIYIYSVSMATDKWFVYIKISLGVVINYTAAKCRRSFGIDVQNPGSDNWIIEFVPLVRKSIGWNCLTPVELPTFSSFYSTLSNDFVATLIERNRLIIYAAEYI